MPTEPKDNALIKVDEVRAFIPGISSAGQDVLLQDLVNAASDHVVNVLWGGYTIMKTTYTNLRLEAPGKEKLYLPIVAPISLADAITISIDGSSQTVWKQESDGARNNFDFIVRSD